MWSWRHTWSFPTQMLTPHSTRSHINSRDLILRTNLTTSTAVAEWYLVSSIVITWTTSTSVHTTSSSTKLTTTTPLASWTLPIMGTIPHSLKTITTLKVMLMMLLNTSPESHPISVLLRTLIVTLVKWSTGTATISWRCIPRISLRWQATASRGWSERTLPIAWRDIMLLVDSRTSSRCPLNYQLWGEK